MTGGAKPTMFDIEPMGDYSLRESAGFIDAWHEAPSEGGGSEGHLHLAFHTDRDWIPVGVCLTQDAAGRVHGAVHGPATADQVRKQVARIMSLDVDGRRWPEVARGDAAVAKLQATYPGFRPVNWSNAFEAAAWCLISSRITMRQAQGIKERMSRELGDSIDIHGQKLYCFPGPRALVRLTSFKGLFGRKVEYLNALGESALAGELDTESLRAMPREDALKKLKQLRGIGEFGSQLVRLRALSAVDELPNGERRLVEAVRNAYGLARDPDTAQLAEIAEGWRPYRMWVAVCLRRSMAGGGSMTHSRAAR
ncbi:MAG TPA: DNA-3-methyladenine glycosylase 2 family protein [Candidatus Dormibacteraeota bacterium]|nr:DNA-3-methyladenine glycosylase 2 family protein [Candidatus Dormibacteraeota bacterium]